MSDWPASYSRSSNALPGPRRQSLKGCIGSLPHMFHWSRMLGSNNKCIATTADVQKLTDKQTSLNKQRGQYHREGMGQAAVLSKELATQSSRISRKVSGTSVSGETYQAAGRMDLRQVLHAKQEPFVLQDVIYEKRHPMRTQSSRELKFEGPSTRTSSKMKKTKNSTTSRDQEQVAKVGNSAACRSQLCVSAGSANVLSRNRVPVETMVSMPSCQLAGASWVCSAKKAHSKMASQGRSPVKSPNKRALLMEAAARILEGSNHRTPNRPMTSVRSLLEELEKSKHMKELSKSKENLARAVVLHDSEPLEREEVAETAAESEKHQKSYDLKLLGMHSCKQNFEMPQILEKDLLVIQNRVFCYGNALDDAEVLPSLVMPVQSPSSEMKSTHVQIYDDLWSRMKGAEEETMNEIESGFKLNLSEVLPQAKVGVLPEVIIMEDPQSELYHGTLSNNSREIVPSTSINPSADFTPTLLSACLQSNFDNRMPLLVRIVLDYSMARHFARGYQAAATFSVNNMEQKECSGWSLIEGADETGYDYMARDRKTMEGIEAERQRSMTQLRLCNYSWWADSCQNSESQLSTESCTGYDSPVAPRSPCYVKVWNADCEEACICVDEFQQTSPVSVLEPVYEEELEFDSYSFDNFDEARLKLLEKVRRYEMLAHMDVDMLEKVSEEHVTHVWDSNANSDENRWWENDDGSSAASFHASPAHDDFSSSDLEAQQSRKCFKLELYADDESLYGQEDMEMRPPTSSPDSALTRKLQLRPISCRVLHLDKLGQAPLSPSQRIDGHIKLEEGELSSSSIVAHVFTSLLHKDLTANNWSSACKQEEEEVELELENCFFDLLMCELLSDLIKGHLQSLCYGHALHPLHI